MTSFAQWLTGGLALLTGTVGVFGATNGDLGRVARNHPVLFGVLLGVALLAITLGIVVAATKIPDHVLFPAALALSVVTVWFSVLVATDESAKEGPAVDATVSATKDQVSVTGIVQAAGLKSREHVLVEIVGRRRKTAKRLTLFRAWEGPDSDGKVDAHIAIVAPTGLYNQIVIAGTVAEKVSAAEERAAGLEACTTTVRFRGCARMATP